MRRRLLVAGAAALIALAVLRLAVHPTLVSGYRTIDEYNIALQVLGARPTWRGINEQTETASEVRLGVNEIGMLQFGAGFGDERIGYVVVTLRDPLGGRTVIVASSGLALKRIAP
jgi:hypothetical protein